MNNSLSDKKYNCTGNLSVLELQALADRNQATAPLSAGPNSIVRDCMKCGILGCNLIEANE